MITPRSKRPFNSKIAKSLLAAAMLLAVPAAQAGDVRLYVLAPQPPSSLQTVETQGSDKPAYAHSYNIPYASVEQQIRNEIKKKADISVGGTADCDVCLEVTWHVSVTNDFSFTEKNQPVVTAFGNAQENGVDVSLQTQFRLQTNIHAEASTKLGGTSVDVPVNLVIAAKVNSKLSLWPDIKSIPFYCEPTKQNESVCVDLTVVSSNIDLSDAHGAVVKLGAALGGLIGASPLAGDPLSGLVAGALLSNAAAKVAEQRVKDEANKALGQAIEVANIRATWLASTYVDAKATQANAVKSKLLDTPLPGVNKSLQELSAAFGLTLDVQTRTSSGDVYVIVTPRFAANPSGNTLVGKLRMPKEACVYGKWTMGTIPLGLQTVPANTDLPGKVGKPCSEIMPASDIKLAGYLGADPKILKVGANPLPNWKPTGSIKLTGNMTEVKHGNVLSTQLRQRGTTRRTATGYFECSFEISGLPNADIIDQGQGGRADGRLPAGPASLCRGLGRRRLRRARRHLEQGRAAGRHRRRRQMRPRHGEGAALRARGLARSHRRFAGHGQVRRLRRQARGGHAQGLEHEAGSGKPGAEAAVRRAGGRPGAAGGNTDAGHPGTGHPNARRPTGPRRRAACAGAASAVAAAGNAERRRDAEMKQKTRGSWPLTALLLAALLAQRAIPTDVIRVEDPEPLPDIPKTRMAPSTLPDLTSPVVRQPPSPAPDGGTVLPSAPALPPERTMPPEKGPINAPK
ncbi:MAG: hypothetical protein KIT48_14695 [Pseudolabrys sp.]|nr:hypothetical protein [Pseudolabrys sp.]